MLSLPARWLASPFVRSFVRYIPMSKQKTVCARASASASASYPSYPTNSHRAHDEPRANSTTEHDGTPQSTKRTRRNATRQPQPQAAPATAAVAVAKSTTAVSSDGTRSPIPRIRRFGLLLFFFYSINSVFFTRYSIFSIY